MSATIASASTDVPDWGQRDPRWAGTVTDRVRVGRHDVTVLRHPATADGTPIVLVHGLGGSARNWLEVTGALSAHGEVVAVDLPGFGETPLPAGGSARVPSNARFLAAFIRSMGWPRAVLVGNSMGGQIALLTAATRPDLVERLILVNPALPGPLRAGLRTRGRAQTRVVIAGTPLLGSAAIRAGFRYRQAERLVDDSIRGVYADVANVRAPIREVMLEGIRHAQERPWRVRALGQAAQSVIGLIVGQRTLMAAVAAVEAPALLVWGDADALILAPVIDALRVRRPDWDVHVFPNVGHAPMLEAPDDFVKVVSAWLERPPPA